MIHAMSTHRSDLKKNVLTYYTLLVLELTLN
nr:MAG TPA: hypothetical protein [Bacteriophage sp.]